MINPKELRIGNLIHSKIFNSTNFVTGFIARDGKNFIYTDLQESYSDLEDWEPIPLTPEILNQFWFDKQNDYWICGGLKIWKNEGSGKAFYHINSELLINLDYVHELQNLYYAVTQDELEVRELITV